MPFQVELHDEPFATTVTIAESASLSAAISIAPGHDVAAIAMPEEWTAAAITFQVSIDEGATYQNAYDEDGSEITITAAANHYIPIPANTLRGAMRLKLRSGTAASPVNQAAARTLTLITTPT